MIGSKGDQLQQTFCAPGRCRRDSKRRRRRGGVRPDRSWREYCTRPAVRNLEFKTVPPLRQTPHGGERGRSLASRQHGKPAAGTRRRCWHRACMSPTALTPSTLQIENMMNRRCAALVGLSMAMGAMLPAWSAAPAEPDQTQGRDSGRSAGQARDLPPEKLEYIRSGKTLKFQRAPVMFDVFRNRTPQEIEAAIDAMISVDQEQKFDASSRSTFDSARYRIAGLQRLEGAASADSQSEARAGALQFESLR